MEEPYWWYVLYVKTNTEHRVVSGINLYYSQLGIKGSELVAFCPEAERYYRNAKKHSLGRTYLKRPLFPNYVFIETNIKADDFLEYFSWFIYNTADIIKLLRNGDSEDIAISYDERKRFEYLFKGKRYIERSKGFIVGDKVVVQYGPLVGLEGCIKKIDRHNRDAEVAITMFERITNIKIALEIVSKV